MIIVAAIVFEKLHFQNVFSLLGNEKRFRLSVDKAALLNFFGAVSL